MNPRRFALFAAGAAGFVWITSGPLPAVVASHFDGAGMANGFMPHRIYVAFMLALLIGLPVLVVALTWWSLGSTRTRINLPNRDYWLAPERREQTVAWLRSGLLWFGVLLLGFMCYAHWLVVLANAQQPAKLDNTLFITGLAVFVGAVFVWLAVLLGRFRRRS